MSFNYKISFFPFIAIMLLACSDGAIPLPEEKTEPVFLLDLSIAGIPHKIIAGEEDYFMFSNLISAMEGDYQSKSELKKIDDAESSDLSISFNLKHSYVVTGSTTQEEFNDLLFLFCYGRERPISFGTNTGSEIPVITLEINDPVLGSLSTLTPQTGDSYFHFFDIEEYELNEEGDTTKKIGVEFRALFASMSQGSVPVEVIGNGVIAVAY